MRGEGTLRGEGDRFLIARVCQGDEEAFRQLVNRFSGRLAAYAARRLHGAGIDPEDAVQETFLGLLRSLERLEGVRSLQAYLFQILRHKIADLTGKAPQAHGIHPVPLAGDTSSGGVEPVAPEGTPSGFVHREEAARLRSEVLADILEDFLGRLKEERNFRDLKILELLFYSSWRSREIAAAVGTSEPTVSRIKSSALASLSSLAARHPRMDPSLISLGEEDDPSHLIQVVWRENLLSCLKRSTLGAYALGALERDWADYVTFHLETVGCETCSANLTDLKSEQGAIPKEARDRLFASSVGFLKKRKRG